MSGNIWLVTLSLDRVTHIHTLVVLSWEYYKENGRISKPCHMQHKAKKKMCLSLFPSLLALTMPTDVFLLTLIFASFCDPFPLILILFLTFLDSQSWPPDFLVTNTTSLSAWHSLEDYCFARASENFLLSWPWQPPLSVVYLEKKEGQRPPHRNICVSTHFLRSTWTIFLHTMLAIRGGLMLLFNENHL